MICPSCHCCILYRQVATRTDHNNNNTSLYKNILVQVEFLFNPDVHKLHVLSAFACGIDDFLTTFAQQRY